MSNVEIVNIEYCNKTVLSKTQLATISFCLILNTETVTIYNLQRTLK